jgi:hypothetical protein
VDRVFGLKRGVFDLYLRLQLCNLRFRLQQLLSHRPLPLHPLKSKRLRLRIRPQQLQLQRCPSLLAVPTPLHLPPPRLRRRLLLHHRPHSLVGHGGGEIADRWLMLLLLLLLPPPPLPPQGKC